MYNEEISSRKNADAHGRTGGEMLLDKPVVIPVIEEQLTVEKKVVQTGKIQIHKHVETISKTIDIPLLHDEYDIERRLVNEYIETAPQVRYEGDTIIIPVIQEVLVKRLLLTEEIIITKHTVQTDEQYTDVVRTEKVIINRTTQQPENE